MLKSRNSIHNKVFKTLPVFFVLLGALLVLSFYTVNPENLSFLFIISTLLFIFLNLWYYFNGIYLYANYTTSAQRFWKRTFSLFWAIEGFLFSIVIFLFIISPQESSIFIDSYNQTPCFWYLKKEFSYCGLLLLLLLSSYKLLFIYKKEGSLSNRGSYILLATFLLLCNLMVTELFKFTEAVSSLETRHSVHLIDSNKILNTSTVCAYSSLEGISSSYGLNTETIQGRLIRRTDTFYIALISVLKFWHLGFIISLNSLLTFKALKKEVLSQDVIATSYTNVVYVFAFFLTGFILFFKKYFYFFLKWPYFWFFESYSMSNYVLLVCQEIVSFLF